MKLYEFFGVPAHGDEADPRDQLSGKTQDEEEKLSDELYWFILDDDQLNKEYFMPLAKQFAKEIKNKSFDRSTFVDKWMPMVNNGCMRFYKKNEMTEDPKDLFTKELRKGLCQRFAEQHHQDIEKDEYRLG